MEHPPYILHYQKHLFGLLIVHLKLEKHFHNFLFLLFLNILCHISAKEGQSHNNGCRFLFSYQSRHHDDQKLLIQYHMLVYYHRLDILLNELKKYLYIISLEIQLKIHHLHENFLHELQSLPLLNH